MRTYNYSEVQQNFSSILSLSLTEEVIVKEKNGRRYRITPIETTANKSPFDVQGINTDISTDEMIDFLRESRVARSKN